MIKAGSSIREILKPPSRLPKRRHMIAQRPREPFGGPLGANIQEGATEAWEQVDLPHDFIITGEPSEANNAAFGYVPDGKRPQEKIRLSDLFLPILAAIFNGMVDFSQKLFVAKTGGGANTQFTLLTYVFSAIVLGAVWLILRRRDKQRGRLTSPKEILAPIALYVLIMAVCLFLYSYLKTAAAAHLPSATLYPLSQGGTLVLSTLMSALLLKEKLGLRAILGIILAFGALLLTNLF